MFHVERSAKLSRCQRAGIGAQEACSFIAGEIGLPNPSGPSFHVERSTLRLEPIPLRMPSSSRHDLSGELTATRAPAPTTHRPLQRKFLLGRLVQQATLPFYLCVDPSRSTGPSPSLASFRFSLGHTRTFPVLRIRPLLARTETASLKPISRVTLEVPPTRSSSRLLSRT